jgi:hypothetical protein
MVKSCHWSPGGGTVSNFHSIPDDSSPLRRVPKKRGWGRAPFSRQRGRQPQLAEQCGELRTIAGIPKATCLLANPYAIVCHTFTLRPSHGYSWMTCVLQSLLAYQYAKERQRMVSATDEGLPI